MPTTIEKLTEFARSKPALAEVPIIVVDGIPLSLNEVLYPTRLSTILTVEQLERLKEVTLSEEESWLLAEEHYRRLSKKPLANRIRLLSFVRSKEQPSVLSFEEILEHIKKRDAIGERMRSRYERLRKYILELL